jgi:hypothetical protein
MRSQSLTLARDVHLAVAAVCPIDGVAIGDPSDKATWRIDFAAAATAAQRQAAQAALAAMAASPTSAAG